MDHSDVSTVNTLRSAKKQKIAKQISSKIGKPACIIFLIVAVFMFLMVKKRITLDNQEQLTLESQSAAHELNGFFQQYIRSVEQLAVNPEVKSIMEQIGAGDDILKADAYPTVFDNMLAIQQTDAENVLAVWIGDIDSSSLTQSDLFTTGDDYDITSRAWFQVTKTGEAMLSVPYVDASTGMTILSAVAPVFNQAGSAIGVTGLDLTLQHVGEVLQDFAIGEGGYVIMTTSDGTIIYHPEEALIQQNLNDLEISESVTSALVNGESSFLKYRINGTIKYGYLTEVGETGYYVLSCLPSSEFYSKLFWITVMMVIIFAVGLVFIFQSIRKTAQSITKPIEDLNATAQQLADGNLDVSIAVTANNEIGELGDSISKTVDRLKSYILYIDEIATVLEQFAEGRLAISLQYDYAGEFGKIKDAMMNISTNMNSVIKGIINTAEQVSNGADDLAGAAVGLAEAATTQSAAVEELVATTDSVVEQVRMNMEESKNSANLTKDVTRRAEDSQAQMSAMCEAMQKIDETSKQVVGIIQTIEEIADQTNLLALNASIEAARAGESGKGFAVVATEIGSLASESAKAANSTRELIGISMEEIGKGNALAKQVTERLEEVVTEIEKVNTMIMNTAETSESQTESMEQIRQGIGNISHAVQDTSATAEESSATSEELAAQATTLTHMVQKFEVY